MKTYTAEDVRAMDSDYITPAIAAGVLGCDPQSIRIAARQRPDLLHFPAFCVGNRVKIPRLAFLRAFDGREALPE